MNFRFNIAVVLFISFLIRLVSLDQSLWLDEATTAKVVRDIPFDQMISTFSRYDFHPPLFYFIMKLWTILFGYSEIALRFPSVIFSLLTGYVIYHIGRKMKDKQTGLWAAVFFLFNPLIIYYSQEARMYMMATFFISCTLYFLIPMWKKITWEKREILGVNTLIFLSFATFYGSVFIIMALYIWTLITKKYRLLIFLLPGFALSVLIHLPLLYLQFHNAQKTLQIVTNWSLVLGKASIKNLFLIPLKFFVGRISFYPKIIYWGVAGLWSAIVLFFVAQGLRKARAIGFITLFPLVIGFMFSFFSPLLQYFRFLYLLIPISLLLSLGARSRWRQMVLLGGFLLFSSIYLFLPQHHREDWKELVKRVPPSIPTYAIASFYDPIRYYGIQNTLFDLRSLKNPTEKSLIIIPYGTEIYGLSYKDTLIKNKYKQTKTASVRGLTLEEWQRE